MKQLLLAGSLLPILAAAQTTTPVQPVYSNAYLSHIRNDSNLIIYQDSTNSIKKSELTIRYPFYGNYDVRKIVSRNGNSLSIKPVFPKTLILSGTFSSVAEWQKANRSPALQNRFVQGRNSNGNLQWNGPETDELFSYGPEVSALEYDGSNYPWDPNGRLVPSGTGYGKAAQVYNNSILRTGFMHSQSIQVNSRFEKYYNNFIQLKYKGTIKNEKTYILQHKKNSGAHNLNAEWSWQRGSLKAGYYTQNENADHSNRNGLLNRIFQNSLLSPLSFSTRFNSPSQSWSQLADNPFLLLNNPDKGLRTEQQLADMNFSWSLRPVKLYLIQSLEKNRVLSNENIQAGTVGFPSGYLLSRQQQDKNYTLKTGGVWGARINDEIRLTATLNYLMNDNRTSIDYTGITKQYSYHRTTNDVTIILNPVRNGDNHETGITLIQKWTKSGTSKRAYWLTSAGLSENFTHLFNNYDFRLKLAATYNRMISELAFNRSLSSLQLLNYTPQTLYQFLPVSELKTMDNLVPAIHGEWQALAEFQAGRHWTFSTTLYNRKSKNEIHPYLVNNEIYAANCADSYNRGIELELRYSQYTYNKSSFSQTHSLSFNHYRAAVTRISSGFENLPLAGFSNVYKALVKGQAPGAIMGQGWLRNSEGQVLIGADGFPLTTNAPVVLGNPVPDFVLKLSHSLNWKAWSLNLDWDWKKGGSSWNGTQAMLDYYGRSAESGDQRAVHNYIFQGVLSNGQHNAQPVDFYNPSLPFEQNRWVRYGATGVAEAYIQQADYLRISNLSITWKRSIRKFLREAAVTAYLNNLLLWSPYKGADPEQLLFAITGTQGLDFFNLPAQRSGGIMFTIQF